MFQRFERVLRKYLCKLFGHKMVERPIYTYYKLGYAKVEPYPNRYVCTRCNNYFRNLDD